MIITGPQPAKALSPACAHDAGCADLLIPEVVLISRGPMKGPEGVVFSTAPQSALASSGKQYVVKGEGSKATVVAELLGYRLAGILNIPVPGYGVGRFGDGGPLLFASEMLAIARDVTPWLTRGKVANADALVRLLALDVLIANNDRNLGNLLARPASHDPGSVEIVAIDFEKAQVVQNETPLTGIPLMDPRKFWPTGILGQLCRKHLDLGCDVTKGFSKLTDACITQTVKCCCVAIGGFSREDDVYLALNKRMAKLKDLVNEAWA